MKHPPVWALPATPYALKPQRHGLIVGCQHGGTAIVHRGLLLGYQCPSHPKCAELAYSIANTSPVGLS